MTRMMRKGAGVLTCFGGHVGLWRRVSRAGCAGRGGAHVAWCGPGILLKSSLAGSHQLSSWSVCAFRSAPPSRSAKTRRRNPATSACSSARASSSDVDSESAAPSVKAPKAGWLNGRVRGDHRGITHIGGIGGSVAGWRAEGTCEAEQVCPSERPVHSELETSLARR